MADRVTVKVSDTRQTEALLSRMPIELRGKQLTKAIRKAGNIVAIEARRRAPKPGYEGDDPSKTPLDKTIRVKVVQYRRAVVGIVGPSYPEGAHGHLVEYGHAKVLWGRVTGGTVPPHPFLRPAADATMQQQRSAMISFLKQSINELVRA